MFLNVLITVYAIKRHYNLFPTDDSLVTMSQEGIHRAAISEGGEESVGDTVRLGDNDKARVRLEDEQYVCDRMHVDKLTQKTPNPSFLEMFHHTRLIVCDLVAVNELVCCDNLIDVSMIANWYAVEKDNH